MINPAAPPERKLSVQQKICALYLATIWLTSQYTLPFGDFERIPFYVVFTGAMYFVLPLMALLHFCALLLVLAGYELLKSIQTDFVFSTKGALGLVAFSCVMSTVFFAVKLLRDCSTSQLGNLLRLVVLTMAAAVAIEIGLSLDGLTQPAYQNYLLPIPAFTGLFTEPSHFALALSPLVFMLLIEFRAFRRHVGLPYVGVLAVLAVLCPSGTLIGITALAACIWFSASALRMRIGGLAGVAILGIVVGLAIVFVPEISERVFGVLSANAYDPLGEQNLSALLFEKGKQMAEYALWNFPLGVAFLDMAILAPYAPVSHMADVVFYLNSQDGSSILFKGICELGILLCCFFGCRIRRILQGGDTRKYIRKPGCPEFSVFTFCPFHSRWLILSGMFGHWPVRMHIRAFQEDYASAIAWSPAWRNPALRATEALQARASQLNQKAPANAASASRCYFITETTNKLSANFCKNGIRADSSFSQRDAAVRSLEGRLKRWRSSYRP